MAVLGRLLISSAERLDLPDFLSIDSYTQGDFKYLMKSFVGSDRPYVLAGFDVINPGAAIGTQNISVRVADSVVYYPESLAGPFFHGLEEGNTLASPLVPELRKNSTNYVYLTLTTAEAAKDTRAFWDPDKEGGTGGEFTQDINTQTALVAAINVSTSSFPEDTVPVCIVEVGPNFITSIEDARDMMFRLGTGGLSPDPLASYSFREQPDASNARLEPNTLMTNALDPNAFQGGDKNILSLKEWMDVVMTKLKELSGTTYWYEDTSTYNLVNIFKDALSTSIKSKGVWQSSDSTPGLLTWTEDILVQSVSDNKDRIIRAGNKTLADNQTMYMPLVRRADINSGGVSVNWFNGLNYINGSLGAFENLTKGDWIKKSDDPDHRYLRVEEFYDALNKGGSVTTPANALSIKLSETYGGISELKRGVYDKGIYLSSDVLVADRDDSTLTDIGGDLYWLAMRSDTEMSVSDITTTTLALNITNHDGLTAKCSATSHGLTDKQRIYIAGSTNFDGEYAVEVEDVNTFYINITGGPFADELAQNAHYAIVTTQARSADLSPDIGTGIELESANHGFDTDQTITISDTSNYNGSYKIFNASNTTFTIPVTSIIANETSGTATAVTVFVRTDIGPTRLDQGENKQIGETDSENIMSFIGMDNATQTHPAYHTLPDYNTIDGFVNYNADVMDNLTQRVSKLTAMMADKAQDKTIVLAPSGYTSVNNVVNGAARDISFTPAPSETPNLDFIMPSSDQNNSLVLTGTMSLLVNQAAYIELDRNDPQALPNLASVTVANITDIPLDENVYVLALRLSTDEVWLWDGFYVSGGVTPVPSYLSSIVIQNNNAKLIRGGTWSWDSGTGNLTWSADAYLSIAGLTEVRNTMLAQTVNLAADGDIAYVEVNRSAGGATNLTVNTGTISTVASTLDTFIIARRLGNIVAIGADSGDRLISGESQTLDASASNQTLTYIGAADEADSDPNYTNSIVTVAGEERTITFPAAAVLTSGQYWTVNNANDTNQYYVWANIDGAGGDPAPANLIPIEVALSGGDTNIQVAGKYFAELNALADFTGTDNADGTIDLDNAVLGQSTDAADIDMGPGFSISTTQQGVGQINVNIFDAENLTQSIKRLDQILSDIQNNLTPKNYEEIITVVAGAPADDNEVTGPVTALTNITIPKDSRNSNVQESYTVGSADLEIFLNGRRQCLGQDYNEIGAVDTISTEVEFLFELVVGDVLKFSKVNVSGGVTGSGSGTDERAKVSANDTTSSFLINKIVAGTNVTINEANDGSNETLVINSSAGTVLNNVTTVVGTDTAITSSNDVVLVDNNGSNVTITLPDATLVAGKIFYLKKIDSGNTMFIASVSNQTLDGVDITATPHSITVQYESITIVSDGANWFII